MVLILRTAHEFEGVLVNVNKQHIGFPVYRNPTCHNRFFSSKSSEHADAWCFAGRRTPAPKKVPAERRVSVEELRLRNLGQGPLFLHPVQFLVQAGVVGYESRQSSIPRSRLVGIVGLGDHPIQSSCVRFAPAVVERRVHARLPQPHRVLRHLGDLRVSTMETGRGLVLERRMHRVLGRVPLQVPADGRHRDTVTVLDVVPAGVLEVPRPRWLLVLVPVIANMPGFGLRSRLTPLPTFFLLPVSAGSTEFAKTGIVYSPSQAR